MANWNFWVLGISSRQGCVGCSVLSGAARPSLTPILPSVPLSVLPQWDSLLISTMLLTCVSLVKQSTSITVKILQWLWMNQENWRRLLFLSVTFLSWENIIKVHCIICEQFVPQKVHKRYDNANIDSFVTLLRKKKFAQDAFCGNPTGSSLCAPLPTQQAFTKFAGTHRPLIVIDSGPGGCKTWRKGNLH